MFLGARFPLHDIEDVERFCAALLERDRCRLEHYEREDLLVYLVEECWRFSLKFRPGRGRFSVWVYGSLRRRVVDWERQRYGRTVWKFKDRVYERPRVELVSLDDVSRDRLEASLA